MSVFVIGDTHLSHSADKPMDVFGSVWQNHAEKLRRNWCKTVKDGDTVVIAGDVSWGMSLEESLEDFRFLSALPGNKILLKGNHDYWWDTVSKMRRFLADNGIFDIEFLYNDSIIAEDIAICGTRGWVRGIGENDEKMISREAGRLERSLISAGDAKKVVFMHYPPVYAGGETLQFIEIMQKHGVERCYYGHLHAQSAARAVTGRVRGIDFFLVSADALDFCPLNI